MAKNPEKKWVSRTGRIDHYASTLYVYSDSSAFSRWGGKKGAPIFELKLGGELPCDGDSAWIGHSKITSEKIDSWIIALTTLKEEFSKPKYRDVRIGPESSASYYDSREYYWEVRYDELETDDEFTARLHEEEIQKARQKDDAVKKAEQERLTYERLKKKFEGK